MSRFTVHIREDYTDIALALNKMSMVEMDSKSLIVCKALRMFLTDRGYLDKEGKYIANNKIS